MKKANQSQQDTDIENRNYDSPIERPPRLDLRNDSAPVRDPDLQDDKIQKRQDLGGTSVYQKDVKSAASSSSSSDKKKKAQDGMEPVRLMNGFEPNREQLAKLVEIEIKLDMGLKFVNEATAQFSILKSIDISPDGKLGGRGFALEIPEIRARLFACIDHLSHIIDTLYDETRGAHWQKPFQPPPQVAQPAQQPEIEQPQESQAKLSSILTKVIKKANDNKGS